MEMCNICSTQIAEIWDNNVQTEKKAGWIILWAPQLVHKGLWIHVCCYLNPQAALLAREGLERQGQVQRRRVLEQEHRKVKKKKTQKENQQSLFKVCIAFASFSLWLVTLRSMWWEDQERTNPVFVFHPLLTTDLWKRFFSLFQSVSQGIIKRKSPRLEPIAHSTFRACFMISSELEHIGFLKAASHQKQWLERAKLLSC